MRLFLIAAAAMAVFWGASLFSSAAMAQNQEPLKLVKKTEQKIKVILEKPTEKGTKKHEAKKQALRKVINQMFDFEELAKKSLGSHYDGMSAADQKEFVSLLQKLIEKNYLMKISDRTEYKLIYTDYSVEDQTAAVVVKVKSGTYELSFSFSLYKTRGSWYVFDMIIDDVSLIENYSGEFNSIIVKDGVQALLAKMRKKLKE